LRSLASRAPRASSPSTALATWQASRESPLWVSWRLTPARRSGRWPGSSCPGTAGTPGPATPRRPGAGGSAPSGTGRRRSPGPARGGRGASAKSTANPAQSAAPGRWSGRGRRVLDLTEHDPLQLVRVGPEELIAGHPAGMLGRRMLLQFPWPDHPMAAALERAPPLQPRLTRIVVGEEPGRTSAAGGLAAGAHQHCEQALDLLERPGRGPAERTVRPHSAPLLLEHSFERIHKRAALKE
jgi:hypothetical protein